MNPDTTQDNTAQNNTAQNKQQILRERARVLARVPERETDTSGQLEVVEFVLADERYALETLWLREVYTLKDLTPLPCTPPFVRGIINVRGQILAVIDLRRFFDLPERVLTDLNRVVIVQGRDAAGEEMELGLLADAVLGVRRLPPDALQASLPTLTGVRAEYLKGVTAERLIVLDVPRILADKRIVVDEEVEA